LAPLDYLYLEECLTSNLSKGNYYGPIMELKMNYFLSMTLNLGELLTLNDFKRGQPNSLVRVEALSVEARTSEVIVTHLVFLLILLF
jgi:hypothetical protein